MCFYISEDLWSCIEKSDQESLFNSWRFSNSFALAVNGKVDFKSWLKNQMKSIDIDKSLYRDKVLNRLLDEV